MPGYFDDNQRYVDAVLKPDEVDQAVVQRLVALNDLAGDQREQLKVAAKETELLRAELAQVKKQLAQLEKLKEAWLHLPEMRAKRKAALEQQRAAAVKAIEQIDEQAKKLEEPA